MLLTNCPKPVALFLPRRPDRRDYEREDDHQFALKKWKLFSNVYHQAITVATGLRPRWVNAGDQIDISDFGGVIISGGRDVNPELYFAERHPETQESDPDRDQEIGVVRAASELGIPLLGICRGMQVMAVTFGGTLEQHIPVSQDVLHYKETTGKEIVHDHASSEEELRLAVAQWRGGSRNVDLRKLREMQPAPGHFVKVDPKSALFRITGLEGFQTTGRHHQGLTLARLASGILPVATTEDRIIEAIEFSPALIREKTSGKRDTHPLLIGYQWHPERLLSDPAQFAIFSVFGYMVRLTTERGPEDAALLGPHDPSFALEKMPGFELVRAKGVSRRSC